LVQIQPEEIVKFTVYINQTACRGTKKAEIMKNLNIFLL